METITIKPKNKKELETIKRVLEALEINYNESKTSSLSPEFLESIKQGREDYANGKCKTISIENLWK